jgi:DNA-binding response OmpR family regulator
MSGVNPATAPDLAFAKVQRFGSFTLHPARKLLLDDGRTVRLGGRALDLLIALVERAGDVVSHDELFARVWPRAPLRVAQGARRRRGRQAVHRQPAGPRL